MDDVGEEVESTAQLHVERLELAGAAGEGGLDGGLEGHAAVPTNRLHRVVHRRRPTVLDLAAIRLALRKAITVNGVKRRRHKGRTRWKPFIQVNRQSVTS